MLSALKLGERLDRLGARPPYLLGVSGGRDSMVLWRLLHEVGRPYAVAHVNYGLRGAESAQDERLVRTTALALHCPCHVLPAAGSMERATGVQAPARDIRRSFFGDLLRQHGYASVLLAHHADDQLETLIQRLLRGAGPHGQTGMRDAAPPYYRPLLRHPGSALAAYAKTRQVVFREDSSNATDAYQRNRLRHRVLPLLYEENPVVWRTAQRSIDALRDQNDFAREAARQTLLSCRDPRVGHAFGRTRLSTQRGLPYLLWLWLEPRGFGGATIRAVGSAIGEARTSRRVFENDPRTVRCVVAGDSVYLEPTGTLATFAIGLKAASTYLSPTGKLTVHATLPRTVVWRTAAAGDSIELTGGGGKELRRLLSRARRTPVAQARASVLVAEGEVVACLELGRWSAGAPVWLRERLDFEGPFTEDLLAI